MLTQRNLSSLRQVGQFIVDVDNCSPTQPHTPPKVIPVTDWEVVGGLLPKKPNLAILMPCSGRYWPPEMGIAMATLQFPPAVSHVLLATKGQRRDEARCDLLQQAIDLGAEYALFLDDDNPPPPDTVLKLTHAMENADDDVAIVAGIYTSRSEPAFPFVFGSDGQCMWKWKAGQVFECDRIATGCMLIRLSALAGISKPWFRDIKTMEEINAYWEYAKGYSWGDRTYCFEMTDDIYFCWKIREAGFRILAHGGVLPGHWDDQGNCYRLAPDSYPMRKERE